MLARSLSVSDRRQSRKRSSGSTFRNPVGLAAGFDKNGVALPAWAALGFGFVEIGTVTAKAQPGKSEAAHFPFPEQGALINRLGFNNDGADPSPHAWGIAPERPLARTSLSESISANRRSRRSKKRLTDYLYSFRLLPDFADYVVLNVSSPNTPGLRSLQEHDALEQLLRAIREKNQITRKPVLLKIAPDLSVSDLEQIIATCEQNEHRRNHRDEHHAGSLFDSCFASTRPAG